MGSKTSKPLSDSGRLADAPDEPLIFVNIRRSTLLDSYRPRAVQEDLLDHALAACRFIAQSDCQSGLTREPVPCVSDVTNHVHTRVPCMNGRKKCTTRRRSANSLSGHARTPRSPVWTPSYAVWPRRRAERQVRSYERLPNHCGKSSRGCAKPPKNRAHLQSKLGFRRRRRANPPNRHCMRA